MILGSIGLATVCLILCSFYLLWSRPKFLYLPIYENYEKDSDGMDKDDTGAEMVEGHGQEEELLWDEDDTGDEMVEGHGQEKDLL
mmetsp:Transcript_18807/g.30719  ORF Transcript_18807/g.30719 Transcript_18807/m.30719 type:complete len:85 (-) Transcript_18807:82-336(-)